MRLSTVGRNHYAGQYRGYSVVIRRTLQGTWSALVNGQHGSFTSEAQARREVRHAIDWAVSRPEAQA